jgi:PAS domain S-box-containing protein
MLADKIAGASQTSYEIDCITKDRRRVTLEVSSSPIYKNGVPVAVQGIARDITERKRTEAALKESEEQYRDLFENANDLIYTHDLKGNFTSLNRAGEIITGFSREEALMMNIGQVIAPDYLEKARAMIHRKVVGEPPTTYEVVIVAKQGHRVSLELSTRLIMQGGEPIGVQGVGRDITERKRTEEALKESEARYRSLGEGIMHLVWTAQPDGKLGYVNNRTLEYFGCTSKQMLGEGWQAVVHPEDLPDCVKRWTYSLETGNDYQAEFRLRRYDGRISLA